MKRKATDKEILNKIVELLNEKGFTKESLHDKSKDELKPILREIYKQYNSFGGMEKSPKANWREACQEILAEKAENKEDIKTIEKDDNYKSMEKEEIKKDILKREDYDDDLIQLEFPKVYIDRIHGPKIEKLSEQLEKQRKEERQIKEEFDKKIAEEIKTYLEKQDKSQQLKVDESNRYNIAIERRPHYCTHASNQININKEKKEENISNNIDINKEIEINTININTNEINDNEKNTININEQEQNSNQTTIASSIKSETEEVYKVEDLK